MSFCCITDLNVVKMPPCICEDAPVVSALPLGNLSSVQSQAVVLFLRLSGAGVQVQHSL